MNVKIEYQFTRDDYVAILRAARRLGFMGRLRFWLTVAIMATFVPLWVVASTAEADFALSNVISNPLPLVIVAGIFTFYLIFQNQLAALFNYSSLTVANRTISMVLDDFGVHAKVGESEGRTPWSEFRWFVQKPNGLFLFLPSRMAFLIPLRAVADASSLAELAEAIRSKLSSTVRR